MIDENLKLEDLLEKRKQYDEDSINNVAIIGAGLMGQGIAQTVAASGLDVLLIEKDVNHLDRAKGDLSSMIDREIRRWTVTQSEKKAILSRIEWETTFDKISECDLVIEAVDENFELKKGIFQKVDVIADRDTIFISNTSTLSLTKIAECTTRPEKVIGMHFLNPVPKIPLVELVKCLHTSNETVEKI